MAKKGLFHNLAKYKMLYIMFIPTAVCLAIFSYAPLWGLRMAFYDYLPWQGSLAESEFVGLLNFRILFNLPNFGQLVYNTLIINIYKILLNFPAPILFAILLNEVRSVRYKRLVQTVSYLPHFVSWIIVSGLLYAMINGSYGMVNNLLKGIGITPPRWYVRPDLWRSILVGTDMWKTIGFDSILYLAAIAGINNEMYEAAVIDGAGRFKQILYITLPSILPTIVVLFIMRMGSMMSGNFQQIYALVGTNTPLYATVDVLDYNIYRIGLQKSQYSLATTMGIFQSVISFVLVVITNKAANKAGGLGVW